MSVPLIPPSRFAGTVQPLGPVRVTALLDWLRAIPWEAWPQQDRLADGQIRPAMVNDPRWHDFGAISEDVVRTVAGWAPGGTTWNRMLSVVMQGHAIPEHVDAQPPRWWGRVHVPLTTDPASAFVVGGVAHHLAVGTAYLVNTEVPHSVTNERGRVPRVHFMVDVGA